ncbi:MAG: hypothetical protein ACP5JU_03650 [Minisyncoccia bacterium]
MSYKTCSVKGIFKFTHNLRYYQYNYNDILEDVLYYYYYTILENPNLKKELAENMINTL